MTRVEAPADRASSLTKNLLLACGACVVSFLIGEGVVRVLPRQWVPELGPVQPRQLDIGSFARPSTNPALYYELAPGHHGVNEAGYRGPLYPEEKPDTVWRVVAVGNSTAFGLGVNDTDTYLRRLERLLTDASDRRVQVVNLAVPGYNTEQELEMLRVRGFRFHPDLVVLGYDHNDPKPILGRARPTMPDHYGRNLLHSELVRYLARKFYSRPELRLGKVDGHVTRGPQWDRHLVALSDIGDTCRAEGVPVVVVIFDAWIQREDRETSRHYRALHKPLQPIWSKGGFHVMDCYDLFEALMREHDWSDTKALWVSVEPRDGHPNAEGHRLIAEAAFQTIRDQGLLR